MNHAGFSINLFKNKSRFRINHYPIMVGLHSHVLNLLLRLKGDEDFKKAWALSNLQPLWAIDNLKKGTKLMQRVNK